MSFGLSKLEVAILGQSSFNKVDKEKSDCNGLYGKQRALTVTIPKLGLRKRRGYGFWVCGAERFNQSCDIIQNQEGPG